MPPFRRTPNGLESRYAPARLFLAISLQVAATSRIPAQLSRAATGDTEPVAEHVYKNIRVLKGVPASTFMNTMFFQRYALGVACTYCHVDAEWDRDDKPAKTKARQMMQMVLDLNRNTFHDAKAVNCVTCHRGATIPQSGNVEGVRLTFDQMLTPHRSAATPPPPSDLPSVQAVIERYLAALGGRDKLASVQHTVTQGTLFTAEGRAIPYEETYACFAGR
jgi:hypothetical protein